MPHNIFEDLFVHSKGSFVFGFNAHFHIMFCDQVKLHANGFGEKGHIVTHRRLTLTKTVAGLPSNIAVAHHRLRCPVPPPSLHHITTVAAPHHYQRHPRFHKFRPRELESSVCSSSAAILVNCPCAELKLSSNLDTLSSSEFYDPVHISLLRELELIKICNGSIHLFGMEFSCSQFAT
ncbi:unnamed protein product [Lactuca saligna]|uniref:Uncharacterized protein n=1 Tax=Lactuca saligna TaxID=75948 RepID=A0AA35ZQQ2_LACSI|nr:unnamed protein product [Lactuca saligna]